MQADEFRVLKGTVFVETFENSCADFNIRCKCSSISLYNDNDVYIIQDDLVVDSNA